MRRRPILILLREGGFGTGQLGDHLARAGLAVFARQVRVAADVPSREELDHYAALALMGVQVPALEPNPLRDAELELAREALARDMPTLGVGLGARVLALAAGGEVTPLPFPEVGWTPVSLHPAAAKTAWLDRLPASGCRVFAAHGEVAVPPDDALPLLSGPATPCQAYVRGTTLGVEFHPEITRGTFGTWLEHGRGDLPATHGVQSTHELRQGLVEHLAGSRRLAGALYDFWVSGLRRTSAD